MKTRRHHNNTGLRQIQRGKTRDQVRRIAKRLGIPFVEKKPLVDCIASGYNWVCPKCQFMNREIDWPREGQTSCKECDQTVELDLPVHAYE